MSFAGLGVPVCLHLCPTRRLGLRRTRVCPPPLFYVARLPCASYLKERVLNRRLNVNVEYRDGAAEFVTVVEEDTNVDIGKDLLEEGLVIFKNRTGAHLQPLMKEYAAAQQVDVRSF